MSDIDNMHPLTIDAISIFIAENIELSMGTTLHYVHVTLKKNSLKLVSVYSRNVYVRGRKQLR